MKKDGPVVRFSNVPACRRKTKDTEDTGDTVVASNLVPVKHLPNLSALSVHRRRNEEDIGVFSSFLNVNELQIPTIASLSQYFSSLGYATDQFTKPYALNEGRMYTSELWKDNLLCSSDLMKKWEHLDDLDDIEIFFANAKESPESTLAHVVLVKKSFDASEGYPSQCEESSKHTNACYHGHITVVFEPHTTAPNEEERKVVSFGFFPLGGDAWNLKPGYKSAGNLKTPDPMLDNWEWELAMGKDDAEIEDYVVILNTFLVDKENIDYFHGIVQAANSENIVPTFWDGSTPIVESQFNFFAGLNPWTTITDTRDAIVSKLQELFALIFNIKVYIGERPLHNNGRSYNCATWMLAAFPEADMFCFGGVPALCTPKKDIWTFLTQGISNMISSARGFLYFLTMQSQGNENEYEHPPPLKTE